MGNDAKSDDAVSRCLKGLLKNKDRPHLKKWKKNLVSLADVIAPTLGEAWEANPGCRALVDIPADWWKNFLALPCLLDWVEGSPKRFYETCEMAIKESLVSQYFAAIAVQDIRHRGKFWQYLPDSRQAPSRPGRPQIDVPDPGSQSGPKSEADAHEAEVQKEYVQFLRACQEAYADRLNKAPGRAFENTAVYLSFLVRHHVQHHSNVRISFGQLAEWFGFDEGNLRQRCWWFMKDVKARLTILKEGDHP
jgi:hypothetical protein